MEETGIKYLRILIGDIKGRQGKGRRGLLGRSVYSYETGKSQSENYRRLAMVHLKRQNLYGSRVLVMMREKGRRNSKTTHFNTQPRELV